MRTLQSKRTLSRVISSHTVRTRRVLLQATSALVRQKQMPSFRRRMYLCAAEMRAHQCAQQRVEEHTKPRVLRAQKEGPWPCLPSQNYVNANRGIGKKKEDDGRRRCVCFWCVEGVRACACPPSARRHSPKLKQYTAIPSQNSGCVTLAVRPTRLPMRTEHGQTRTIPHACADCSSS